ncbi:hypothetical protein [Neorhizobium alkalisoli]|jgi:hypothetical protein|uniref:Uncharacterized protein n=1 Tax=Neorhizobium alkalisoli TaxID=528178 RepID=A0A561QVZ0_9HYPH|nr:hypothetical protein [Neorhizobium alkalisoli]TWF54540.1 hypothetical protein FHW37_103410 [Neorhizobium alkalisoli]
MTAHTYSAIPPIELNRSNETAHPLRPVFITVIALKIVVSAFLIATVSLAPPVSAETRYMTVASN